MNFFENLLVIIGGLLMWIFIIFLIIAIIYSKYKKDKIQDAPIKIAENLEKLANTQNTNAELLARIEKLEKALQEQKK